LELRASLIGSSSSSSNANGSASEYRRPPPFLSKARYKSYEDAIVGGLKSPRLLSADERTASSSPVGVKKPSPAAAAEPAASVSSVERELEDVDRILHPIAAIHVALREQARLRRNLILATEPVPGQRHQCGRALSARKDLQIRRQLCGFPPATLATMAACAAGAAAGYLNQELHADAPLGGGGGTASPALHEQIVQMYRQMVAQQRQQASQGICTTLEAV
uniref:Uncharacterized protein n=1 Tax=Anopheles coluzzii TaxID=1518534 RepID=A0A8W7P0D3_ANOCL